MAVGGSASKMIPWLISDHEGLWKDQITLSCYSFIVGHLWAQLDLLKNASKGVR